MKRAHEDDRRLVHETVDLDDFRRIPHAAPLDADMRPVGLARDESGRASHILLSRESGRLEDALLADVRPDHFSRFCRLAQEILFSLNGYGPASTSSNASSNVMISRFRAMPRSHLIFGMPTTELWSRIARVA